MDDKKKLQLIYATAVVAAAALVIGMLRFGPVQIADAVAGMVGTRSIDEGKALAVALVLGGIMSNIYLLTSLAATMVRRIEALPEESAEEEKPEPAPEEVETKPAIAVEVSQENFD